MKKAFMPMLAATLFFITTLTIVQSCTVEDLVKDVDIQVSGEFLVNPINVQVFDAADISKVPAGLVITIEGKDKDKLYSLFGEKNIKPVEGMVALTVKKADLPTIAKPLEFTLVATAPNFISTRKAYVLTEAIITGADKLQMVNPSAAPAGVTAVQTTVASTAGTGTPTAISIASPLTGGKTEQAKIEVSAGTKLLASDGSEVSGSVTTTMVHFDAKNAGSVNSLPGGLNDQVVVNASGAAVDMTISPVSFYKMNMSAGGKDVKTFSKPLDATVDIDPNTFLEEKGRLVQAGDVLDVLSREDDGTAWKTEGTATVTNVGGKLQASFKQSHLSFWLVGANTGNKKTVDIKVSSNVPSVTNASCGVALDNYYYQLVNANNPIIVYAGGFGTLANNSSLGTIRVGKNILTKLVVFNSAGVNVLTSAAQNLFTNATVGLQNLPASTSVAARFKVAATCVTTYAGGSTTSTTYIPNMKIQYREMDNPNPNDWSMEFEVKNGEACVTGLKAGKYYNFSTPIPDGTGKRIVFSTAFKQPKGLLIPANGQNATYNIFSPVYNINQDITFNKGADGVYSFNYNDRLPDNICTEIDKLVTTYLKK